MKLKLVFMLSFLVLSVMAIPVSAAASNTTELLRPGMGSQWLADQGADIQSVINYILGALIVFVAIGFVYYVSRGGLEVMRESTEMGNPQEKSRAMQGMLGVGVALIIMVLIIKIGSKFFGWY